MVTEPELPVTVMATGAAWLLLPAVDLPEEVKQGRGEAGRGWAAGDGDGDGGRLAACCR